MYCYVATIQSVAQPCNFMRAGRAEMKYVWWDEFILARKFIGHLLFFFDQANLTSLFSHELQFSLGEIIFVLTLHMHLTVILSSAYFVAQRAGIAPTNRVFPFNVALHLAECTLGIATDKADEAACRLHHQAFVD